MPGNNNMSPKDWFEQYAAIGVEWLTLKSLQFIKLLGWLIVIPLIVIFGTPLAILGWFLGEHDKDDKD